MSQTLTDTLQEVNIKRKRQRQISGDEKINTFSPGQKIKTIDSLTMQQYHLQSVSNLLSQQTPVFIKSYGLNGLATLNFRGSSAAQSQVFWNGIPIQNASLGIADISLLPVSMINKLHIIYGSSSAMWGSGNVGGALLMETDPPTFDSNHLSYTLAAGAGSYGQYTLGAKAAINNTRWSFSTNVLTQSAKNNFRYTSFGERKEMSNSHLKGITILPQLAYKLNAKNTFRLAAWYQNYYREIPPALFESSSVKNRKDQSLRVMLDWNRKAGTSSAYTRTAFLTEKMNFNDEAVLMDNTNTVYQYFVEAGWKKKFGFRHSLMLFTPVQISWMQIYAATRQQSRYAIAAAYAYNNLNDRFHSAINLRVEATNNRTILLPGINGAYLLSNWLTVRANVQKTYRAPTLNELYYDPGGNKDLKPEQGWSGDIGYKVETKILKTISLLHDVSAYNRVIDDWIIWLGGAIWTPHNIASVHSRGIETENLLSFPFRKWKFHIGLNTSYTLATTLSSYLSNDGSIGKQIPYTPKYNGQANLGFTWNQLHVNYNHNYTGSRYVNIDESDLIPSYSTSNLQLSYLLSLRSHTLTLSAQLNNILGSEYQVVKSRPMPGTNYLFGLSLSSR